MANMSIEELIEEIEVYVDNCKTAGVLSSGSMIKINREELLAMLDEVRTRLPKERAESRQIIKSKESIIADAKARAERIVKDAAKEAFGGKRTACGGFVKLPQKGNSYAAFQR